MQLHTIAHLDLAVFSFKCCTAFGNAAFRKLFLHAFHHCRHKIFCTLYTADGPLASGYVGDVTGVLGKANLAQTAFGVVFGESAGNMFVAVCLFFFAFSTILSWNLFGKINVSYLFGKKSTVVYTVLALVFIFLGTMMSNDLVWELSDMFNNLMVIPNAVALFALTSLVVKHADDPNRIPGKK